MSWTDTCALCGAELPPEKDSDVQRSVRLYGRAVVTGKWEPACLDCVSAVAVWCFNHKPEALEYDALMTLTRALPHEMREGLQRQYVGKKGGVT